MTAIFDEAETQALKQSIACRRYGTQEDLLKAIDFSIATPFLNSGVIDLNGGIVFG
jgi:hypothetical protein